MGWLGFGSVGLVRAQGRKARRKGAQGGVVLRGWVQWYEVRGIWGKNWGAVWKKVPFRVAKIGSKELPVPPSGRDLYRKNDYTQ